MSRAMLAAVAAIWMTDAAGHECTAPGERVHWIADYCMLKMQTDDEIAVSGCIESESKRKLPPGCGGNAHFKRAMCETMIAAGTRKGTLEQCLDDPSFKGRTVANKGVPG